MAVAIRGLPQLLEAETGNYAVMRVDVDVRNVSELDELGVELARLHSITSPRIEVRALRDRGNRYLIVVTGR